ncbi:MAG: bifunctional diaminohydroxyphosphoribosylaminopyrimidine deaminase/5-amino-6-(5-phosphoribosylamino)uracil reductase RibD, partial [Terriglobales bacterium]
SGGGIERMAAAGVKVETDCLGREARRLNEDFSKWIRTGLPFVTLKTAVSLDGRIAGAGRKWISSQPSRDRVQMLRHQVDAVMTGIGTVISDDPLLTDRTKLPRRRPLLRVVLDTQLRLPNTAQIVKGARRHADLLVCHATGTAEQQKAVEKCGARILTLPNEDHGKVDLAAVLARLGSEQILSVLLEGGATVNGAMLTGGWVDKLILFQAPLLLGNAGVPLAAFDGELHRAVSGALVSESVGPDLMIEAYLAD